MRSDQRQYSHAKHGRLLSTTDSNTSVLSINAPLIFLKILSGAQFKMMIFN